MASVSENFMLVSMDYVFAWGKFRINSDRKNAQWEHTPISREKLLKIFEIKIILAKKKTNRNRVLGITFA